MQRLIAFHGSGGNQNSFWLPWLRKEMEQHAVEMHIPNLPEPNEPELKRWLESALHYMYDENTIIVGHSSGATLILSLLERLNTPVKRVILVAGFARRIGEDNPAILQSHYDWKIIAKNSKEFIFINSDNDPWGCNDQEGRFMLESIGHGILIIPKGEGHMGSGIFEQPYLEFPLLKSLILK